MPETKELEISEFILEYLEPIPGNSPNGVDAGNEEEYFKLNMEIPKTVPDYKKCIELSNIILKEKSKDIKVAAWLCFALFRAEKIKGLKDGLSLIFHLLNKFGNDLFPANVIHRSKAIQFLNQPRFYKLVEREEINRSNAADIIEANIILSQIINEIEKLFPGNVPLLKAIKEVITELANRADSLISPPKQEEKISPVHDEKADKETITAILKEKQKALQTAPAITTQSAAPKIVSENDALKQLRQILTFFFEAEKDGVKKEQIPESHFVFGISRQLQWGKLFKPPDNGKITQIEAPNQIIQGKIKEWFASSNWDTLIPRIEINFLKQNGEFPYWLDVQRYVTKALEQKGGNYLQAAEDIKIHLARLLNKIPDLPHLKFKDKQTPFADDETIKWINDEVKPALSSGKGSESIILPPILGEDYDPLNKEYENACNELPDSFEENLSAMQKAVDSDTRRKGRFLRRLNLANFSIQAKQYSLARVNLLELKNLIEEYNLIKWEPALCTSVWQSLYLTNTKLLKDSQDENSKQKLEIEQQELFSKIAKYDGILAIKLTKNNK